MLMAILFTDAASHFVSLCPLFFGLSFFRSVDLQAGLA
jgi:hypothetical protein